MKQLLRVSREQLSFWQPEQMSHHNQFHTPACSLKQPKEEKYDFEWIPGAVMMKWVEWSLCFELLCFGEESFVRKSDF